jgi:PHYB activation tagged suppressor 1
MSMDDIVAECKTFFFAGHDTTSHLLTWAIFLLGTHPEWQRKLREEVLRECGGVGVPLQGDALNKLKLVSPYTYLPIVRLCANFDGSAPATRLTCDCEW